MNGLDPKLRFSLQAVRAYQDSGAKSGDTKLNPMAQYIAAHYRQDTMSPVMVSGWLRVVEFVLLTVTGIAAYISIIGLGGHMAWQYPVVALGGSLLTVILIEFTDGYSITTLRRPPPISWALAPGVGRFICYAGAGRIPL